MAVLTIEYIVTDPHLFHGKPHIAGRRIRVEDIAGYHNAGWTVETIADQFDLTPAEIYAALSYYSDHKQEIDQTIREDAERIKAYVAQQGEGLFDRLDRQMKEDTHER
ncbi:MAG: DUF433 domain-containing protein [Aggregatilineales bacterium]